MKELREFRGTSAIVYQQMCAAEKRRQIKKDSLTAQRRRVVINEEICEGCGDCSSESNCLSVLPKPPGLAESGKLIKAPATMTSVA